MRPARNITSTMSTRSILSLPPKLEMTSRSITRDQMRQQFSSVDSTNASSQIVSNTDSVSRTGDSVSQDNHHKAGTLCEAERKPFLAASCPNVVFDTSRLVPLTENTFPLSSDQPLNIKIMLHAAAARQQMTSTRSRKVTLLFASAARIIFSRSVFSSICSYFCCRNTREYLPIM